MFDLHLHTRGSDNPMLTSEILTKIKQVGIHVIAVTDHDTMKNVTAFQEEGPFCGVQVIPGIEISSYDPVSDRKVHLLGYFPESYVPEVEQALSPIREMRQTLSYQAVKKIRRGGYSLYWEDLEDLVDPGRVVFKTHIMEALRRAGYCKSLFGSLFYEIFNDGRDGGPTGFAFQKMEYFSYHKAISIIRDNGGIPVLAHPAVGDLFDLLPDLKKAGLGGIEVYHPAHCCRDRERALAMAESMDLLVTGGTDYHGHFSKKNRLPGCKYLTQEDLDRFSSVLFSQNVMAC